MKGNLMKSKKITNRKKETDFGYSHNYDDYTPEERHDAIDGMLNDFLQSDDMDDFRLELEKQRLVDRMILND